MKTADVISERHLMISETQIRKEIAKDDIKDIYIRDTDIRYIDIRDTDIRDIDIRYIDIRDTDIRDTD